ncbi:hypothetical protein V5799_005912 [Amblyomma americanum]|uniref:Secreted protein n=1 Tax=Amblyomma americanum TaxID=6943 RepID=A0AAQ4DXW7_AMBAM
MAAAGRARFLSCTLCLSSQTLYCWVTTLHRSVVFCVRYAVLGSPLDKDSMEPIQQVRAQNSGLCPASMYRARQSLPASHCCCLPSLDTRSRVMR